MSRIKSENNDEVVRVPHIFEYVRMIFFLGGHGDEANCGGSSRIPTFPPMYKVKKKKV